MVGDSLRDLQAGVAAGCAPHLVRTGKGARARRGRAARARRARSRTPSSTPTWPAFAQQLILRERQQRGDDADEADSVFVALK